MHWVTQYDLDALDITHFRYPMGSFPLGLFGCTCSSCTAAAQELGYDMAAMVADLQRARENLRQLDGTRLGEVIRLGIGFFDVVHALGLGSGVLDWVRFRCDLIVRNLARFRAAVHAAAPNKAFGTDTYPASMALTAGHDYRRWGEMADFASPLVSHISALSATRLSSGLAFCKRKFPTCGKRMPCNSSIALRGTTAWDCQRPSLHTALRSRRRWPIGSPRPTWCCGIW